MNVENVGGPERVQNQPPPAEDPRRQGPAQASAAQARSRGRDVLELNSKKPSPVEKRDQGHQTASDKVEQLQKQQAEAKAEKSKEASSEKAKAAVHERIQLQKEKSQAELEGNDQKVKEVEREILISQGEKNIDLLA